VGDDGVVAGLARVDLVDVEGIELPARAGIAGDVDALEGLRDRDRRVPPGGRRRLRRRRAGTESSRGGVCAAAARDRDAAFPAFRRSSFPCFGYADVLGCTGVGLTPDEA
jgi:hypothetical protein